MNYLGGYLKYLWHLVSGAVRSAKGVISVLVTLWGFVAPYLPYQIDLSPELIAILRVVAIVLFPLAVINEGYKLHVAALDRNDPAKKWDHINRGVQEAHRIIDRANKVNGAFATNNDSPTRDRYTKEMRTLTDRGREVLVKYFPPSEVERYDNVTVDGRRDYPEQSLFIQRMSVLTNVMSTASDRLKSMPH